MNQRNSDPSTDSIDLSPLTESGQTQTCDTFEGALPKAGLLTAELEANIIVISHPEGKRLGNRFRLRPGSVLVLGRSTEVEVSMPEVLALSRRHARLCHHGERVTIQDLGSTNGTFVNDRPTAGEEMLASGDRFQVASVHFKFLHERDVEHAYYEAIYQLVTRDGLTDAYNKRKYDEEAAREFARALRHRRPLALVVIDLDHFKQVNDVHGHLCGDFVLKELANRVRARLRPEQIFARIGGDEFVVLSPETGAEGAREFAERLVQDLDETPVRYGGLEVRVTCSCGVAELAPDMDQPNDLYAAADRALYRSKDSGRHRVSVSEPAL